MFCQLALDESDVILPNATVHAALPQVKNQWEASMIDTGQKPHFFLIDGLSQVFVGVTEI